MKRFLLSFAVLAAVTAPPLSTDAYACVCAGTPSIATALSQADAVFSGQVVSVDMFRARVQVDRVWKGDVRSEITLLTGARDGGNGTIITTSCQMNYRAGERYVVFASGSSDQLQAHVCSRTGVASAAEIQGLDAVILSKKVGTEIGTCAASSTTNLSMSEIRIFTANPDAQSLPAVALTAEGSGRKYGALTDRSGRAVFSGLQPGQYRITVGAEGYLAKQSAVTVPANGCVEASVYLLPIAK